MRLFIVDDSTAVRARLVEMCSGVRGVEVIGEAAGAGEAIEKLLELHAHGRTAHVVILDLQLARGSGLKVLEAIGHRLGSTRIMVLTNHVGAEHRRHCKRHGAAYFFDKCREFEKVEDTLRELAGYA